MKDDRRRTKDEGHGVPLGPGQHRVPHAYGLFKPSRSLWRALGGFFLLFMCSFWFFQGYSLCFADILDLTNGNQLEGRVVEEDETTLRFETESGVLVFDKEQVVGVQTKPWTLTEAPTVAGTFQKKKNDQYRMRVTADIILYLAGGFAYAFVAYIFIWVVEHDRVFRLAVLYVFYMVIIYYTSLFIVPPSFHRVGMDYVWTSFSKLYLMVMSVVGVRFAYNTSWAGAIFPGVCLSVPMMFVGDVVFVIRF